jgi:capsular exopolysaccharide synthesis family protein
MVATSKPGQGATTTVCNLAIALAQAGKKVILIDADLRRPALHKFFAVSNETGLSTLLKGKANPMSCLRKTEIPNLIIIPAGPPPLNPSELLACDRMWEIVERLKDNADLVLFDTPSTLVFSDGPVLASWLDAVLFVMSADEVPRGTEHEALEMLRKAKANIIGVVVNRMSPDSVDNCYFYAHYYPTEKMDLDVYSLPAGAGAAVKELSADTEPGNDGWAQDGKQTSPATLIPAETAETNTQAGESESDNPFPH